MAGFSRTGKIFSMLHNGASGPEHGLPGRISAGFSRESIKIGPPAGLRPAGGPILGFLELRLGSKRNYSDTGTSRPAPPHHNLDKMMLSVGPGV